MRIILYHIKPRVVKCQRTNMWVVNSLGSRHTCDSTVNPNDLAFRRWENALDEANLIAQERMNRGGSASDSI